MENMIQRPILNGKVNFPVCLAPMVGLSHIALRQIIRSYMPENAFTIWPTEMLNSRRLPNERVGNTPETLRLPEESGLVPQILGNEENFIAQSVKKLSEWGAEGIDINMGCPVERALRHNYGVALMGDPEYASQVVAMTVRNTKLPVSVKFRASGPVSQKSNSDKEVNNVLQLDKSDFSNLIKFVHNVQIAGAQWVTLHPRTAAQKRRGLSDWSLIRKIRSEIDIPLIGNGDIQNWKDVLRMQSETQCDMVMAGRALAAKPWICWQLGHYWGYLSPKDRYGTQSPANEFEEGNEYGKVLQQMIFLNRKYFGEDLGLRKTRFWIRTTSVWLEFGHSLLSLSTKARTTEELEDLSRVFFELPQRMYMETDLRQ